MGDLFQKEIALNPIAHFFTKNPAFHFKKYSRHSLPSDRPKLIEKTVK